MSTATKIRTRQQEGYIELKLLISHPMENGRNRDPLSGELISAHFIQELIIELNGTTLMVVDMGGSIAKNPFFSFRLKTAGSGDRIGVRWIDNRNLGDSVEHVIE